MKTIRGFTLIELIVVIAVVGILAAIAVPTFIEQLRKSRRAEAVRGLSDLQLREERWRANHTAYATMDTLLGSAAATTGFNAGNEFYNFTIDNVTATTFRVNATAKGAQASDTSCSPMQLEVSGTTVTKSPSTGRCWN